jgi:hypothetical protein
VIGHGPANTKKFGLSRESFTSRRSLNSAQIVVAGISWKLSFDVCLKVNPVGKPDAGDPHVRFDERGWETESW